MQLVQPVHVPVHVPEHPVHVPVHVPVHPVHPVSHPLKQSPVQLDLQFVEEDVREYPSDIVRKVSNALIAEITSPVFFSVNPVLLIALSGVISLLTCSGRTRPPSVGVTV